MARVDRPRPRKDITPRSLLGRRPKVLVYIEGGRVKVQWWERGRRRYQTWADSPAARKEARAFAQGSFERLTEPAIAARLTVRQLWAKYAEAEWPHLRPRTRLLYQQRWRQWELFIGPDTVAEDVPTAKVAEFRAVMTKRHAVAQVLAAITTVKVVYNWADQLELLGRNRVSRYRFKRGKEEKVHRPPEFRTADWEAMLRALAGGQDGRRWKAWAALLIAGSQGERINAVLQLRWDDIDWSTGRMRWRPETNKQGNDRWQPLTWEAFSALLTAQWWAEKRATDPHVAVARRVTPGPWVFPSARDPEKRYPYSGAHALLRRAEAEAGIPHIMWRAFHGLRKMAAGNVAEQTGDPWLALQWIGDKDPRRAQEYLQTRDDRMDSIANTRHEEKESSE